MRITLTKGQLKILADFFVDFAKGLALAAVVGQGFILQTTELGNIIISQSVYGIIALFALSLALYFSRRN